ncbi:MAG TPA: TAXI family TRAP transporter solute-binding subunit [Albitalea sp.]|jgi:TRAP transporter TAXI family solute receptor|nr:TAXI family TRAP transporter solute-binding subunit [Albitalea sp.]
MSRRLLAALIAAAGWLTAVAATPPADYKIVTASERGTYIQIGRDIAKLVAPTANIELQVLPSAGSAENVQRLRYEPGVKFAMVQSDVYQAYLDLAAAGNAEAGDIIRPLRVIMPLYNEEIYFIARSDSELNFVHDIKDAKINVGPLKSGTAMSATTIFRQMFGSAVPEGNASYLSNEDALVKLIGDKSIDVVVVVAGQPAKLLVDMKPEARQLIKLLKFDAGQAAGKAALKTYFQATVRAASYPNLLAEDVPSVAVKAFLVTYDYKLASTADHLGRFARSLCQNFGKLQSQGHPKWREVDLGLPNLGQGWSYYPLTERALRSCVANMPKPKPVVQCTQQERILGLCK